MIIVDLHNPTKRERIIYDGMGRQLSIKAGETKLHVGLSPHIIAMLNSRNNDLVVRPKNDEAFAALPPDPIVEADVIRIAEAEHKKPAMVVVGQFGIGDNLHQRGAIRELMKTYDVWLQTCHVSLYHDLIEQGLKVFLRPTHLRAQAKTIERERDGFRTDAAPRRSLRRAFSYLKPHIDRHGSILEAQYASVGISPPARPDFSLPIRAEWREAARKLTAEWKADRPLLIYRPIVVRREWDSSSRNPDPKAFAELFAAIRKQFFVVSLADLEPQKEWIIGDAIQADVELHNGELDFGTMAALFAEAHMVFSPAGFAPVLAQAVGTPGIIIYGGRESFKTTERAGAHLAPTLGIDPIRPCDCHSHHHRCHKDIDIPQARANLQEFVAEHVLHKRSELRTLIVGTTYIDSEDRAKTLQWWEQINNDNYGCDRLIVDTPASAEPLTLRGNYATHEPRMMARRMLHRFPDNVGHLARGGKDGWGRAFCYGLQAAIDGDYEYVVHIEGDLLFRPSVDLLIDHMQREGIRAASVPVSGTKHPEMGWVETGVIAFSVRYLVESKFIERYNWADPHKLYPRTPEYHVRKLLGADLKMMNWRGQRNDTGTLTPENVIEQAPDYVTHADIAVLERFMGVTPLDKIVPALDEVSAPFKGGVAVIVAGAECWREDLEMAQELCRSKGIEPVYFYVNDQIAHFAHDGIAITLHPDKLEKWLSERAHKGYPPPTEIWAHRAGKHITHNTRDWAGSSGLLGVKVAREKGFERVICCGVPMTAEAGHFVRKSRWHAFNAFRKGWELHKNQIAPHVRSCSGWTAQMLGKPDEAFLEQ